MAKKIIYSEPDNYIPEEIRKKYGLGEYNDNELDKDISNEEEENEEK